MKSEFFNFNRIGRTKFLAYTNLIYLFLAFVYYLTFGHQGDLPSHELFYKSPFILIFLIIISFLPLKFLAQRYKDNGLSGWWALVGVIPYSFFMLYLLLGFYRGERYTNRHGSTPNKSGLFLQLIAFPPILALFFFIIFNYT